MPRWSVKRSENDGIGKVAKDAKISQGPLCPMNSVIGAADSKSMDEAVSRRRIAPLVNATLQKKGWQLASPFWFREVRDKVSIARFTLSKVSHRPNGQRGNTTCRRGVQTRKASSDALR